MPGKEMTFMFIKPDGVERGLIGEIIGKIEKKGFKIKALKMKKLSVKEAEELYSPHKGKPFFKELVNYVTSGPIVGIVIEGDQCIKAIRKMIGNTNPLDADPGSIRGEYALDLTRNTVHASDSKESFLREHKIIFEEKEIINF